MDADRDSFHVKVPYHVVALVLAMLAFVAGIGAARALVPGAEPKVETKVVERVVTVPAATAPFVVRCGVCGYAFRVTPPGVGKVGAAK